MNKIILKEKWKRKFRGLNVIHSNTTTITTSRIRMRRNSLRQSTTQRPACPPESAAAGGSLLLAWAVLDQALLQATARSAHDWLRSSPITKRRLLTNVGGPCRPCRQYSNRMSTNGFFYSRNLVYLVLFNSSHQSQNNKKKHCTKLKTDSDTRLHRANKGPLTWA